MSVLQLAPVKIGQTGVKPASYKMLSTENLAAVTAVGYIKQGEGGQFFNNNDLIDVILQYGSHSAVNALVSVSIDPNTNVITLVEVVPPGGVTVVGTPTAGHIAQWASPTSLQDGGVLGTAAAKDASDNTKATLASVSAATTAGHVATFSDSAGTVQDGGALGQAAFKGVTDNTKGNVVSAFGASVVGNVLQAADTNGTAQDSGFAAANIQNVDNIIANIENSGIGGSGAGPYTVPVPRLLSTSIVTATLQVATNATAAINKCVPGLNTFDVTFTADPGINSVIQYVCVVSAQ